MNRELTLFEQFIIWLSLNKRVVKLGHETYNHRVYIQGDFTFMELSEKTVAVMGVNLYYKADSLNELIKFAMGIEA